MRENFEILLRAFIYGICVVAFVAVSLLAAAFAVVGVFGTGAFTSDPPPAQPAYFGVAVAFVLWAGAIILIIKLRQWVLRRLDRNPAE